ncbi:MAG: hypothetical protein KDG89_00500 [Geminicoccaceae bacterium]|nr:hypothetical protein [Geminicoccaceae bacterium]
MRRRARPREGQILALACLFGLAACAAADAPATVADHPDPTLPEAPELPAGVRLVGMSAEGVRTLLGEPSLSRDEDPAHYWRYTFSGCSLDLYLYPDPRAGFDRITHVDLRGEAFPAPDPNCLELERRIAPEKPRPSLFGPLVDRFVNR